MNIPEFLKLGLDAKERIYKAGNLGALRDVVAICFQYNCPLPTWAAQALLDDNADMLLGKAKQGDGRHSKWLQKYHDDTKDLERYDTVRQCRKYGIPWTDGKVYQAAALILEGSYAGGSASTMKAAYTRVKKRQVTEPSRYHRLHTINPDLKTAQPLTKRRAEIWAKVRALSKTPEKMG